MKGHEGNLQAMKMFSILTVGTVIPVYTFVETQSASLKLAHLLH